MHIKNPKATAIALGATTLLATALAGCGQASSAPAGTSKSSASPSSSATSASPGSQSAVTDAVIANAPHPNIQGKTIKFIIGGSAQVSNALDEKTVQILNSWGAKASIDFASHTNVAVAALTTNRDNIMNFSMVGGLSAVENGVPLVDIGLDQPRDDYVFITVPSVTKLSQLQGKTIGILSMIGDNGPQTDIILKQAGLTTKQVNVIDMGGQSARQSALQAGRIQGTMLGISSWIALKPLGFHMLYNYTQKVPQMYGDNFWATKTWVQQNPALVQAVDEACMEAWRWFDNPANESAFIKLATSWAKGTSAADAKAVYTNYLQSDMYAPNSSFTQTGVANYLKLMEQYKAIKNPPAQSQWLDLSADQKSLATLGQVPNAGSGSAPASTN